MIEKRFENLKLYWKMLKRIEQISVKITKVIQTTTEKIFCQCAFHLNSYLTDQSVFMRNKNYIRFTGYTCSMASNTFNCEFCH